MNQISSLDDLVSNGTGPTVAKKRTELEEGGEIPHFETGVTPLGTLITRRLSGSHTQFPECCQIEPATIDVLIRAGAHLATQQILQE